MSWTEFLDVIIRVVIIPLIGVLGAHLVAFIKAKSQELINKNESATIAKYIRMAQETVTACVVATNQTFVDVLKQEGKFDQAAQKEAFERTKEAVWAILSEDAIHYLTEAVGDIDAYLATLIEAQVKVNKAVLLDSLHK